MKAEYIMGNGRVNRRKIRLEIGSRSNRRKSTKSRIPQTNRTLPRPRTLIALKIEKMKGN